MVCSDGRVLRLVGLEDSVENGAIRLKHFSLLFRHGIVVRMRDIHIPLQLVAMFLVVSEVVNASHLRGACPVSDSARRPFPVSSRFPAFVRIVGVGIACQARLGCKP